MANEPHPCLFHEAPDREGAGDPPAKARARGVARVLRPNRAKIEWRRCDLESLLPQGHRARMVWAYVEQTDLSPLYAGIKAVAGGSGRAAMAPEILLALWLYATVEGVGSARAIARLTQAHDAYRWLCGGVQVNYHTLADFRTAEVLDDLLTHSVAALLAAGAVKLKRVAQDGMRVRASAGASSFRRRGTLEQHLEAARTQVEMLRRQVQDDPGAGTCWQQAARERAVRERQEKVRKALERLAELEKIKAKQGKKAQEARASTTDAQATVMKMGDGGFRPAYDATPRTPKPRSLWALTWSPRAATWPNWHRWSNRSPNAVAARPRNGWWTGASPPTNSWRAWPRILMPQRRATATQSPSGENAWGR